MMPRKKKEEVAETIVVLEKDDTVYFKASKPLTQKEHEQLSEKIRFENAKSGKTIVLVPFSCDVVDGEADGNK